MNIKFEKEVTDLPIRVRAILGVPEEFLTNEIILSPTFTKKAEKYINKKIEKVDENSLIDKNLLNIAYIYYVCYLLCPGMYARVPKQMENINTKTVLLSIDWTNRSLEMLEQCEETLADALEEIGENVFEGISFAVLTDTSEYPNPKV